MNAIDIVGQELRFHTEHKGMTDNGEQYERGFIDALVHIHNLLVNLPPNPIIEDRQAKYRVCQQRRYNGQHPSEYWCQVPPAT